MRTHLLLLFLLFMLFAFCARFARAHHYAFLLHAHAALWVYFSLTKVRHSVILSVLMWGFVSKQHDPSHISCI